MDHYGIEEGLPSNKVLMSIEDVHGFMWIASDNGVARFDGREFQAYTLEELERFQERTFVTLYLATDPDGTVWLLSNNGFIFHYDDGLDKFIFHEQVVPPVGRAVYVSEFTIDSKGRFLIGSFDRAIVYDPDSHTSVSLEGSNTTVSAIIEQEGRIYVGSREGVDIYDLNLRLLQNLKQSERDSRWLPGEQRIESMYWQKSRNHLWIGSESAGIFIYDLNMDRLISLENTGRNIDVPVRSISRMDEDHIMAGTDGAGIFVFDSFDQELKEHLIFDPDREGSLSSNAIYDIKVNKQNVIFISTYRGGLNVFDPGEQSFSGIRHIRGEENSLGNDVVFSVEEPRPGLLSFGTDRGISLWDRNSGEWSHLELGTIDRSKSPVVTSQAVDQEGRLWAASFNFSLSLFTSRAGTYTLSKVPFELPDNIRLKQVYRHINGELLMGTTKSGRDVYEPNGELRQFNIPEPSDIERLKDEMVMIVNREGISELDLAKMEVNPWSGELPEELRDNSVIISLLVDNRKNLWIGTANSGVVKVNSNGTPTQLFSTYTGLASNRIYDILEDGFGNVWVATAQGISQINDNGIVNHFRSDGIISTDFNRNSGFRDSRGMIYFGTNQGVVMFDPRNVKTSEISKNIIITDFFLNHDRITPGDGSVLDKPVHLSDSIVLAHNQNSLSIRFTSIDFLHPEQGEFQWQLEGFDEEWINGPQNQATYTNLNPGEYTFRLKITDRSGTHLAPESSLAVTILNPFWKTPLAYLIYAAFIAGLIALLLYSNRMRLESKSAEERLHFLIDMAHEIKTPLTLIKAPISDLMNREGIDEQSKESLEVALNSSDKLLKQMMQFLDFRRFSEHRKNVQREPIELIELIRTKVFAFKVLADKKQIELNFIHKEEQFPIYTDGLIIDKIVSNLISNAIKYTRDNGKVELELVTGPKKWNLYIRDNGVGIPKKDRKKIFTLFYRADNAQSTGSPGSGVGLVLASDLSITLGGSLKLTHSDRNGTEFLVTMPYDRPVEASELEEHKESEIRETRIIEEKVLSDTLPLLMVVEDDEELLRYEEKKFREKYQVVTARNGEEALKLIRSHPPDLIISDVMMPKMNGRQLCMNIKNNVETSHIPVILLSGMESRENIQEGLASGAEDYITKPFEIDFLLSKVENLLNTRSAFREKFANDDEFDHAEFSNELDKKFMNEVTDLVHKNISDPELSVNYLCESLGMSRTAFYHKLKSLSDISPADFIRTIRLKSAKKLLLNPANNISEVAYTTGFADAKYFSTLFKKYYGESPSAFVAREKETNKDLSSAS